MAEEICALTPEESAALETLHDAFDGLRRQMRDLADKRDTLSMVHLEHGLARLAEAQMWAERIVLE